jgi:RimJ/RimL family protein N-acetyltransferase
MQHAIAHARNLPGVLQLGLSVSETQPAAIRLYASLGFRSWGSEPRALRHEGRTETEQHMTLLFDTEATAR